MVFVSAFECWTLPTIYDSASSLANKSWASFLVVVVGVVVDISIWFSFCKKLPAIGWLLTGCLAWFGWLIGLHWIGCSEWLVWGSIVYLASVQFWVLFWNKSCFDSLITKFFFSFRCCCCRWCWCLGSPKMLVFYKPRTYKFVDGIISFVFSLETIFLFPSFSFFSQDNCRPCFCFCGETNSNVATSATANSSFRLIAPPTKRKQKNGLHANRPFANFSYCHSQILVFSPHIIAGLCFWVFFKVCQFWFVPVNICSEQM